MVTSIFCRDPVLHKALPQSLRIFKVGSITHSL